MAVLAALALLVQAAVPAPAMAGSGPVTVALCGEHGGTVTLDLPAPPSDQPSCNHCPGCVVVQAPPVAASPAFQAVRYAALVVAASNTRQDAPPSLDPGRHPPTRGPPAVLNV